MKQGISLKMRMNEDIQLCIDNMRMCQVPAPSVCEEYEASGSELRDDDLHEVGSTGQDVRCDVNDSEQAEMNVMSMKDEVTFMYDVVNNIGGGEDNISCTFKRGICMQHELKGNKQTVVSERLVKMKYDYRWITSKKTVYTCVSGFGLPQLSAMKPYMLDRSQLPVESIYGGLIYLTFHFYGGLRITRARR